MGVFSNNRPNIVPGALISSSYVSDIYDLLSGAKPETFILSGSLYATGSLRGTASFATSASYAVSASYAPSSGPITEYIQIPLSDETNSLTTGSAKYTFRMPYNMTLTEVRASVNVAPSGSTIIVDINQSGTSILSTKLSIDQNEKTSLTAATPAVISTSALVNDAEITLDIDQVGSAGTTGKGLKVLLKGTI